MKKDFFFFFFFEEGFLIVALFRVSLIFSEIQHLLRSLAVVLILM